MSADKSVKAVHLGNGNFYDDMRVDIAASHLRFSGLSRGPRRTRRSALVNAWRRGLTRTALRLRVHELLIVNGVRRGWFDEFREYWSGILGGRPFWVTVDFFSLVHEYRKRQQFTGELGWGGAERHIANWQSPSHLYQTLHFAAKLALDPLASPELWRLMPRGARILEYGCSLAPYYLCYREYYSHLDCTWVLADLPNFPFHYARYRYRNDPRVDCVTIDAASFADPLGDAQPYDAIILTTVLEHLDDPAATATYLLDRLRPGGLFVFDYVVSAGTGLDHPASAAQREACLCGILERTEIIHGRVGDLAQSVGFCIARKKAVPS
jgi:SAM-dependent methyltransferase